MGGKNENVWRKIIKLCERRKIAGREEEERNVRKAKGIDHKEIIRDGKKEKRKISKFWTGEAKDGKGKAKEKSTWTALKKILLGGIRENENEKEALRRLCKR